MNFFQPKFNGKGRMMAINLIRPVKIKGKDFFGREAWLQFVPVCHPPGWHWDAKGLFGRFWRIYSKNIIIKKRRLCLTDGGGHEGKVLMNHLEHITALRMLGLDAVGISCGPGAWPPYLMAGELWERLIPYLRYGDYSLEWKEASPVITIRYCNSKLIRLTSLWGDKNRMVQGLNIRANINFGKYGGPVASENFFLGPSMDMEKLERIFYSATPGWPPKLYYLAKLAEWLGWPHNKRICWGGKRPIQHDSGEAWIQHRISDIIGAAGAISIALGGKSIISANIESLKGGHESDLSALKSSFF